MEFLKTGTFGDLFRTTFTIAATFQITCALIGSATAIIAPGFFKLNGLPATNPGQALGALAILVVVMMLMNLVISAAGSGLWLLVRRIFFKPQPVAQVFS